MTYEQAAKLIVSPVLDKMPLLLAPNWALLHESSHIDHLTHGKLEKRIKDLTKNLGFVKQQMHVQNYIIEGSQAQLVVQGMALRKLNQIPSCK